jgi:hypothetical protein
MGIKITDAVRDMEAHAFHVSQVAKRIATAFPHLPELIGVRPRPSAAHAELDLQTNTIDEARQWAQALGSELIVREGHGTSGWHGDADIEIDGVKVHVCAFHAFTAEERAARESTPAAVTA